MDPELLVRLILLLPLTGALVCGVLPLFQPQLRTKEGLIGAVGTAAVAIPFALAVYLFATYPGDAIIVNYFTWMAAGDFSVDFAYRIDELSLIMLLVVTGVGSVIHWYSTGYMHGDPGYWRFFAYLNLFIFAMLNLILADNLLVLFLGWEGVGLCSYLLIGFWYTDLKNSAAASKAFIVNRIGDFAFLIAMFLLFFHLGSLDFGTILEEGPGLETGVLSFIVLLLFIGATGKSAQLPLFVWLPDAMAGPTPVSALIHAATMVTSGLYLLARLSPIVLEVEAIMAFIAIVGALTAIVAATIAITQNDIKKVLAYSTVSQLGFMFMAAGVGAFFVAIFHVVTHAFFKGCLFLCSGSVIHSMEHVEHDLEEKGHNVAGFDPQDMRTMGGLKDYMPSTRWTYLIATLAIAGIPLLAGFFSKDEILFKTFEMGYSGAFYGYAVWAIAVVTALLTAFYMLRSYMLTFEGTPRWPDADTVHPHESPSSMTMPLWILAGLSIVGGYIGLPAVIQGGDLNWIHHFLGEPYGGPVAEPTELASVPLALKWALVGLGSLVAIGGSFWGYKVYGSDQAMAYDDALKARLGGLYTLWDVKYRIDDMYNEVLADGLINSSKKVLQPMDTTMIDGAVNGIASLAQSLSNGVSRIQTGLIQNYALMLVLGVILVIGLMVFG
ncbi:MAG: NADH-quinone oxidoreductase subunit L [Longimonas sp.]|uniref:NADH-quinone oxidoreductase subunit L n=1 Tax=Longimonas sp. TaxID=2039626 RepID=UPI003354A276